MRSVVAFALSASLAAIVSAQVAGGAARLDADASSVCSNCGEWNRPHRPFRIFGNTYYVGVAGLSAVLIRSTRGLILIDAALPQSVPFIDANIRALGFKTEDIKFILNGHAHFDHAGGINALQRFTGATVLAGAAGVAALQQGRPSPDDPQATVPGNGFPAISHLRGVRDGEMVRLGDVAITAHATPGHTPGSITWTWRSCEAGQCLNVVYGDSLTPVSADSFRFTDRPSVEEAFRRSIERVSALPCDILLTPHPEASGLDRKFSEREMHPQEPNPFVDSNACHQLAANSMRALNARLKREESAAQ